MTGHGKDTARTYFFPHLALALEAHVPPATLATVRAKAPAFFDRVASGQLDAYVPITEVGDVFDALEAELGVEKTYRIVAACGEEGVGPAALNSFLRLVIKFMPPGVFARKCADFYGKDISTGKITLESFDGDARRFVSRVTGASAYHYVAPSLAGVFTCMMKAMGYPNTKVVEQLHPPPAPQNHDEYLLVVTWLARPCSLSAVTTDVAVMVRLSGSVSREFPERV